MKENLKTQTITKKHKSNKLNWILSTILATIILSFVFCAIYGIYTFFNTYGLQSPIVLRSPLYRLHPEIILSPIATTSGKINSGTIDLGKIADKIYMLESSGGKNDSCKNMGKFNGYGYRQNTFEWICYDTQAEVRNEVIKWLTKHIKDGNIEQALCLYNKGLNLDTCQYAINYKSL